MFGKFRKLISATVAELEYEMDKLKDKVKSMESKIKRLEVENWKAKYPNGIIKHNAHFSGKCSSVSITYTYEHLDEIHRAVIECADMCEYENIMIDKYSISRDENVIYISICKTNSNDDEIKTYIIKLGDDFATQVNFSNEVLEWVEMKKEDRIIVVN